MPSISLGQKIQAYRCFYDGYWGNYHTASGINMYENIYPNLTLTLYTSNHPSDYFFKIYLPSNFPLHKLMNQKKFFKKRKKDPDFGVYNGSVEYFVSEDYPTMNSILKGFEWPLFKESDGKKGKPVAKRKTSCFVYGYSYNSMNQIFVCFEEGDKGFVWTFVY